MHGADLQFYGPFVEITGLNYVQDHILLDDGGWLAPYSGSCLIPLAIALRSKERSFKAHADCSTGMGLTASLSIRSCLAQDSRGAVSTAILRARAIYTLKFWGVSSSTRNGRAVGKVSK